MPAEAVPTRRSIREAERRAEREATRAEAVDPTGSHGSDGSQSSEDSGGAAERRASAALSMSSVRGVVPESVPEQTDPMGTRQIAAAITAVAPDSSDAVEPAPTRSARALRRGGRSGHDARAGHGARGVRVKHTWAPRVVLLGGLAAATTVVPLVGGVPGDSSASATALAGVSGLDVLAAGSSYGTDAVDTNNLSADPLASVRAVVSASRSQERTPTCGNLAAEANGSAAAEVASAPIGVIMPLPQGSYRTTSTYGYRSMWGRNSMHTGVDFAAPAGTPIHVVADGVVEYVGPGKQGRSGTLVIVRHEIDGESVWSWYIHMYPNDVYVSQGQELRVGDVIGGVGSYGNSTGPHLHLEIHTDRELTTVDPVPWLASHDAAPLTGANLECFGR
ncbi:M23 family metallopeptidase [Pseudactinotalea sp. HY158]|uniref:M23 family metallopeptidase n=1 Tax=Pseudactinotalea sp. HY158 TaxID=2654547 RepID=UPI00129C7F65|nr:M23 family metallopeptidase [Pseudactinotalea sp. HY158]QGH68877.1 peptidoglycan DD-metalloendopeptidase family protein [Pseudactinotalea sp. HY158]